MFVGKCAIVAAASLTLCSFALAINPNAKPTAGVYDEQTVQANKSDFDATGVSFSAARFAARIRDGYLNNTGGVVDGAFFAPLYSFGTANSKVLNITWGDSLLFTAAGTPSISGASSFGTGSKDVTIDIGSITEGGAVGEKVTEIGLTALSQNTSNFGAVTVKALLNDGGEVAASRNITEPVGQGDTFFAFRAPAGKSIVGINIVHNHPSSNRIYFDDVAFRTAVVAPFRSEKIPAMDVAGESSGGPVVVSDGAASINVRNIGGTRRRMAMEFNISDIGADIADALLELDVTQASTVGNTLSVLGYASNDGVVSADDVEQGGTLLATRTIDGSGLLAISLNAALVKNLLHSGYLGLILDESSGADMTINTSESTSALLKPTLTINYSAVPEPGIATGLLGVGVLTLSRRRRVG